MKNSILFIIGATKTASSTLLGMLNCHPDIFLFYETDLYKRIPSKYSKRFLEKYPDARYFMGHQDDIGKPYKQAKDFFRKKGHEFKIIGDGTHELDSNLDKLKNYKAIFLIRDIQSWLYKDAVVIGYSSINDIIPAAVDYSVSFLQSFLLPDVLHISMEELILDNQNVINKVSDFIGLELNLGKWWEKIDKQGEPKNAQRWWEVHPSSLQKPKQLDIEIEIKTHKFWDTILPIFNKYYQHLEKGFSSEEIKHDIEELLKLRKLSPINLTNIYANYNKDIFFPKVKKQNMNEKLKNILRRCVNKLHRETIKLLG
ncbi:MAG: hypothetical protein GY714_15770 [Desulfobacterales bacterium]|nr:hypothetical protein [Desulfobacterales bacterium]